METEGANSNSAGYPIRALIPEGGDKCLQTGRSSDFASPLAAFPSIKDSGGWLQEAFSEAYSIG
jgi:hypothetical protein